MNNDRATVIADAVRDVVADVYGVDPEYLTARRPRGSGGHGVPECVTAFRALVRLHVNNRPGGRSRGSAKRAAGVSQCLLDRAVASYVAVSSPEKTSALARVAEAVASVEGSGLLQSGIHFDQAGAARILGCTPAAAGEANRRALGKLRSGLVGLVESAGRTDLGRCLNRAAKLRALACAVSDIADAAGADPMEVARAFVAELRKENTK